MNAIEKFIQGKLAVEFVDGEQNKLTEFQEVLGDLRFNSGCRADAEEIKWQLNVCEKMQIYTSTSRYQLGKMAMFYSSEIDWMTDKIREVISIDEFLECQPGVKITENDIEILFEREIV